MEQSKFKSFMSSAVSGTKKFGAAAKQAGSSVKNNIGKSMSKVAETTKDIVGQSGEIGAKLAAVGGAVVGGILNPMKGLVGLFALSLKYLTESEVRATATARATGLMGKNLKEASSQVSSLHSNFRFYGESIDGAIQTIQGMNNALGNVDYTTGAMADHITRFSIGAGIGKDTSAKIMSNFMLTQGSTEKTAMQAQNFAKDLSNAAGVPINLVMDDLANVSDNVSAYLGSNPEALVRATIEARRLGMSLETTAKVADSLLDFESSIEKEMEAQILTGKTLNYDKARQLALQGDTVGAAKDLLAQVGGIGEYNKMNVIQQKALADSVGMGVVEMKKALGTGEKEADVEEERAAAMAKAQMEQANGVKIIATTMEGLNAKLYKLGQIMSTILQPYAEKFMTWMSGPGPSEMMTNLERIITEDIIPAVEQAYNWGTTFFDKLMEPGPQTTLEKVLNFVGMISSAIWACIQAIGEMVSWISNNLSTSIEGVLKFMVKMPAKLVSTIGSAIAKLFGAMGKGMKLAGKTLLKVLKKIPVIGALISFGFAVKRAMDGDWWGAGAEIVSGLASFIPGVGTAVSVAVDAGLMYSDSQGVTGENRDTAADFISRGSSMQKFRKDDLVIGGTKLNSALGLSNNSGQHDREILNALLNIGMLLQQPGQVMLDGRKVGETISMARSYVDR
tara:strand:+ start:190 stop:2220 length:2031 start_codon:yes stop_codon:yes gene_type:complete